MEQPQKVVISRQPAFQKYLQELGEITADTPRIPRAGPRDLAGKHVYGNIPLSLAAVAVEVTDVPLTIPEHLRQQTLTLEQVRAMAGEPVTYIVTIKN